MKYKMSYIGVDSPLLHVEDIYVSMYLCTFVEMQSANFDQSPG